MELGSITKFYGIPWNYERYKELGVTRNSMEYSMKKFHGTLVAPNKISPSSMEFHGTLRTSFSLTSCFLGHPRNVKCIPWNSWMTKSDGTKFHGIPRNLVIAIQVHGSMKSLYQILQCSMKFHGTRVASYQMTEDSIEFMEYSKVFHETVSLPNQISPSSIEFHGTRRAPLQMTPGFNGFPLNMSWNSTELWNRQIIYHQVP